MTEKHRKNATTFRIKQFWRPQGLLFCLKKVNFVKSDEFLSQKRAKKVMQKKIRCFSEQKRYEGVFVVHIAHFVVLRIVFAWLTLHKFCAIMSTVQRDRVPLRVP